MVRHRTSGFVGVSAEGVFRFHKGIPGLDVLAAEVVWMLGNLVELEGEDAGSGMKQAFAVLFF